MRTDDLDQRLIAQLQKDGRRSFRELGKQLGVSPNTVRTRYNQLTDSGVVMVIAIPNAARMGLDFHAVVGLQLKLGHSKAVASILSKKKEIGWIGLVASGYDIMFEVSLKDSAAFGEFKESILGQIPQCVSIDTFVLWDVPKFRYSIAFPVRTAPDEISRLSDTMSNAQPQAIERDE